MIEKLFKTFQQLKNCQKKHISQHNIIDINDFIFLSYVSRNLNTDKVNLAFQNKLIDTALSQNEKKFSNVFMFSKIKSNERNIFKYVLNVKFQSTWTRFALKEIKLRYASIKITKSISKAIVHRLYIQKLQVYIYVKELINNLNVIYSERNFYARNYVKLTIDIFKQSLTKTLTNYINRFNITVAHCYLTKKNSNSINS